MAATKAVPSSSSIIESSQFLRSAPLLETGAYLELFLLGYTRDFSI